MFDPTHICWPRVPLPWGRAGLRVGSAAAAAANQLIKSVLDSSFGERRQILSDQHESTSEEDFKLHWAAVIKKSNGLPDLEFLLSEFSPTLTNLKMLTCFFFRFKTLKTPFYSTLFLKICFKCSFFMVKNPPFLNRFFKFYLQKEDKLIKKLSFSFLQSSF